jgi:hypothetical protein
VQSDKLKRPLSLTATRAWATGQGGFAADASAISRGSTVTQITLFCTDFIGADRHSAELAHLIPANATHAAMLSDVAEFALALPDNSTMVAKQKAIHGTKSTANGSRQRHTGLKHSVHNKILMYAQKHFDKPGVLIVPVLTLKAVKNWSGGSYSVIVLADDYGLSNDTVPYDSIYKGIQLTSDRDLILAERGHIERARSLLESFVHGLAYSFHNRRNELTAGLTGSRQVAVNQLFADMDARYDGTQVKLPTFRHFRDGIRVRLVTFGNRGTTTGHPNTTGI